jgi:hypothetical protein
VVFHTQFKIGNAGNPFPALIRVLDNIGGTNAGAGAITPISTDAFFLIENELNITHRIPPASGRSGVSRESIANEGRTAVRPYNAFNVL